MIKSYVIDTNILIQAPYACQCFEENRVILPLVVLEELDGLKKAEGEKPVVLVTKDLVLRLKAQILGIEAQDFSIEQVYSYVMTIVKNQSLAEEITQNTFYKALTARHGYEGKSREFTWLCSIAKNLAVDECRKNQKYACFDASAAETSDDIANHIADQDSALQIHLVLHELQEPYKEVFQLRVFGELSFSQIGIIFGKTENWARVTYHRARLKIKERMDHHES